ncbi:hypothetical protein AB5I41_26810 [Sphingomonas sp. MMS24-JH45]
MPEEWPALIPLVQAGRLHRTLHQPPPAAERGRGGVPPVRPARGRRAEDGADGVARFRHYPASTPFVLRRG